MCLQYQQQFNSAWPKFFYFVKLIQSNATAAATTKSNSNSLIVYLAFKNYSRKLEIKANIFEYLVEM